MPSGLTYRRASASTDIITIGVRIVCKLFLSRCQTQIPASSVQSLDPIRLYALIQNILTPSHHVQNVEQHGQPPHQAPRRARRSHNPHPHLLQAYRHALSPPRPLRPQGLRLLPRRLAHLRRHTKRQHREGNPASRLGQRYQFFRHG